MTKTSLLVITSDGHMSDDQHAKLTARVEAVASKVGAEVLVLGPGQNAQLINVGVMPSKATAVEIKEGLHSCSAARTDYYSAQLGGGVAGRSDLLEGIDRLRKEMRVQVDQILKRITDAGVPVASSGGGISVMQKIDATTAQLRDELKAGVLTGRFIPSQEQVDAMRLVTKLVNAGAIALVDDQYVQGEQVFRALKIGEGTASVRDLHAKPEAVEAEPMTAVQGEAMSFMLDPLEQGIEQAVRLVAEAEGELAVKLSRHLDALLAIQLEWVTSHEHH